MKLIDAYWGPYVIDGWTFVFDKEPGECYADECYYPMLATDDDGVMFSQWTEGYYDPEGTNTHLGERQRVISERLLNHILERISDE